MALDLRIWQPENTQENRPMYVDNLGSTVLLELRPRTLLAQLFFWTSLGRTQDNLCFMTKLYGKDFRSYAVVPTATLPLYYYNCGDLYDVEPYTLESHLRDVVHETSIVIRTVATDDRAAFWMFDLGNLYPLNTMLLKCQACGEAYYTHAKRPRTRFRKCLFDTSDWVPPRTSVPHHYSLQTLLKK